MTDQLRHALAILDAAVRDVGAPHHQTPDVWEAITTLEGRSDYADRQADTLWRILGWEAGGSRRHQGGRVLDVLRAVAERRY